MSGDLYRTRVYFSGQRGYAKSEDVQVELAAPPAIPGLPRDLAEIEFTPQMRAFELRDGANARREMFGDEISATLKWLDGIVRATHAAMKGDK